MINPNLFDFPSIFGVVKSTDGLKRNQTRPLRAEVQEISIAKYSGGQLKYVGDTENGRDFFGLVDDLYYESKGMDGLFCKTIPWTGWITLKNFQGNNLGLPEKTFDYMLLWDTKTYTVGICTWDACMKKTDIKDAGVRFRVHFDDITFLAKNVIPVEKEDFAIRLYNMIEEMV
tara:strand:+ start:959 stop:1477 length:519 start_codon:yes stop_codon:yes gene_type:complete